MIENIVEVGSHEAVETHICQNRADVGHRQGGVARMGVTDVGHQPLLPVDAANRIVGFCYDAAGNLLKQGGCGTPDYAYDPEGYVSSALGNTYAYDALGRRNQKNTSKLYVYDTGNNVLQEGDATGNLTTEYVYFGGKKIARLDLPSLAVHYYFSDHLGSHSVVTSATGTIEQEQDFTPFGAERTLLAGPNNYKFTGKERDSETGLDYFGARYYGSNTGRFLSPDEFAGGPVDALGGDPTPPGPLPYADITNPQSLNKYSYTYNNPLRYTDPDGHCADDDDDSCGPRYTVRDVRNIIANEVGSVRQMPGSKATLNELYTDLTHAIFNGEKLPKQPGNAGTAEPSQVDDKTLNTIEQCVQVACTAAKQGQDTVDGADKFNNQFGKSRDTRTFKGPNGTATAPVVKLDGPYRDSASKRKTWEAFSRQKDERLKPKPKRKHKRESAGGE